MLAEVLGRMGLLHTQEALGHALVKEFTTFVTSFGA